MHSFSTYSEQVDVYQLFSLLSHTQSEFFCKALQCLPFPLRFRFLVHIFLTLALWLLKPFQCLWMQLSLCVMALRTGIKDKRGLVEPLLILKCSWTTAMRSHSSGVGRAGVLTPLKNCSKSKVVIPFLGQPWTQFFPLGRGKTKKIPVSAVLLN